jgi:hypothetical protein
MLIYPRSEKNAGFGSQPWKKRAVLKECDAAGARSGEMSRVRNTKGKSK